MVRRTSASILSRIWGRAIWTASQWWVVSGIGLMKMIQKHHGRMLGTPKCIKLIMVSLAKAQKRMSILEDVTIWINDIIILSIRRQIRHNHLKTWRNYVKHGLIYANIGESSLSNKQQLLKCNQKMFSKDTYYKIWKRKY